MSARRTALAPWSCSPPRLRPPRIALEVAVRSPGFSTAGRLERSPAPRRPGGCVPGRGGQPGVARPRPVAPRNTRSGPGCCVEPCGVGQPGRRIRRGVLAGPGLLRVRTGGSAAHGTRGTRGRLDRKVVAVLVVALRYLVTVGLQVLRRSPLRTRRLRVRELCEQPVEQRRNLGPTGGRQAHGRVGRARLIDARHGGAPGAAGPRGRGAPASRRSAVGWAASRSSC